MDFTVKQETSCLQQCPSCEWKHSAALNATTELITPINTPCSTLPNHRLLGCSCSGRGPITHHIKLRNGCSDWLWERHSNSHLYNLYNRYLKDTEYWLWWTSTKISNLVFKKFSIPPIFVRNCKFPILYVNPVVNLLHNSELLNYPLLNTILSSWCKRFSLSSRFINSHSRHEWFWTGTYAITCFDWLEHFCACAEQNASWSRSGTDMKSTLKISLANWFIS